jgi:hypothetical protein
MLEHIFYVPVPEKSQVQNNYVIFPRGSCLPSAKGAGGGDSEPLVFTVSGTGAPKPGSFAGPAAATAEGLADTYSGLFDWALTTSLRAAGNQRCLEVVKSDPRVFHSVAKQPFRPSEKAVHVKAFRGSKDGFLFFLPTGILWGFKKPLLFIALDRIVAVSYTNVLQRTFNMVVEVDLSGTSGEQDGPRAEEFEFAMMDQEDFPGIDETYVKRHGLQDRSMAEQRKAKRELAENAKGGKKKDENGDDAADGTDGMTELEKARLEAEQQQQDDDDDDDEEDYDPGSDGDSEGEGESSEEEGGDGGGEGEGEEEEEEEEEGEEE